MPSPEMEQVMAMLREQQASQPMRSTMPMAERRLAAEAVGQLFPAPEAVEVHQVEVGGRPAEWLEVPGASPTAALLYLHGGAYVAFSPRSHRGLAARLGVAAGASVLVPDYRLAPEHPHPAALEDATAALSWLVDERGVDPSGIGVAGDSAGGGLALALLVAWRDAGRPLPSAAVLLSPWVDLTMSGTSCRTHGDRDVMLDAEGLRADAAAYAGGLAADHPLVSPLFADLAGLPPLLVDVATEEVLYDDSTRLADAARSAGVDTTFTVADGLFHVYPMIAGAPEADGAVARAGAFLADRRPGG